MDMRDVVIDKVTVNIGVGESGERLEKAKTVLKLLTKGNPTMTKAKTSNREFGLRKDQPIGVKVTLKGEDMDSFLKAALWVKNFKCLSYSFSQQGSYSFGIADYTDFKGMKYDPEIGIFGMDVVVTFRRRGGYRIARRRILPRSLPERIKVKREEMMEFMKKNYNAEILEVG